MIDQALLAGLGAVGGIEGVMHVRRIEKVKVVGGGHHAVVSGGERGIPGLDASPGLNHRVLAEVLVQALVPADGPFAEAGEGRHDVPVELRAILPHLVAPEVHEPVGKDLGELGEDRVDGPAGVGVLDVEADVVDAEARTGSL